MSAQDLVIGSALMVYAAAATLSCAAGLTRGYQWGLLGIAVSTASFLILLAWGLSL